jgi:hypothetical protein
MDHPSRYALVEVENIHDDGLEFEPIHRVLFNVNRDFLNDFRQSMGNRVTIAHPKDQSDLVDQVNQKTENEHRFGVVISNDFILIKISNPTFNLPAGTLQTFLDQWLRNGGAEKVDYVHGQDVAFNLGSKSGNLGIYLPAMGKNELFKTVIKDGVLPRKTFSMGSANDKRFYMECRKIS